MPVLVLSEGGMDVSRDPHGELRGAVSILVKRILQHFGMSVGDGAFEFDYYRRFPSKVRARGLDKRIALTIRDISRTRQDVPAIVFVIDADGDGVARLKKLRSGRKGAEKQGAALALKTAIGVAVEMVEAWLIGDHNAVVKLLERDSGGSRPEAHPDPKRVLVGWIRETGKAVDATYTELATMCDLDVVASRCPSFEKFMVELKQHGP